MVPWRPIGPNEQLDKNLLCHRARVDADQRRGARRLEHAHLIAFFNAYNMQIGSVYFGIYSGKKFHDDWMDAVLPRNVTKSPGVAASTATVAFLLRNPGQADRSDLLYMGFATTGCARLS